MVVHEYPTEICFFFVLLVVLAVCRMLHARILTTAAATDCSVTDMKHYKYRTQIQMYISPAACVSALIGAGMVGQVTSGPAVAFFSTVSADICLHSACNTTFVPKVKSLFHELSEYKRRI